MKPIVAELEKLRTDSREIRMSAEITDRSWYLTLFKRHFRISVANGHVSQIKLRCDKKFVLIQFDPEIRYDVNDRYGTCSIEVTGDAGTKFELIQSGS